jgi:hypothetical protein
VEVTRQDKFKPNVRICLRYISWRKKEILGREYSTKKGFQPHVRREFQSYFLKFIFLKRFSHRRSKLKANEIN